jgi:hypothetical protein
MKKRISKTMVFLSVFAGTILGSAIAFITESASVKNANGQIKLTVKRMKEDINDQLHIATARLIESSSLMKARARTKAEDIVSLIQYAKRSFKDSFEDGKKKYKK